MQWRYLSQVLTAGGVTILYLSIYGAFGYYHLIDPRSAFVFLAIVVAEAHLPAMAYNAPSIAVMALAGGFLIPLLLRTGRDQYRVLFTYIGLLDLGLLGMVFGRGWRGLGSLAYAGTHLLFWGWYAEHYHPEKRLAALARTETTLRSPDRRLLLLTLGTALAFVTLAIPVQLGAN